MFLIIANKLDPSTKEEEDQ
ncbi:hypothetical protein [Peribacillus butanolivorans]